MESSPEYFSTNCSYKGGLLLLWCAYFKRNLRYFGPEKIVFTHTQNTLFLLNVSRFFPSGVALRSLVQELGNLYNLQYALYNDFKQHEASYLSNLQNVQQVPAKYVASQLTIIVAFKEFHVICQLIGLGNI